MHGPLWANGTLKKNSIELTNRWGLDDALSGSCGLRARDIVESPSVRVYAAGRLTTSRLNLMMVPLDGTDFEEIQFSIRAHVLGLCVFEKFLKQHGPS
jgi:hypothetical protein